MVENDVGMDIGVPVDKQLEAERLSAKGYSADEIANELGCSPDEVKKMVAQASDTAVEESSVSQEPQETEEVTKDLEERVATLHKIADEDLQQKDGEKPYSKIMADINKNLEENKPFEEKGSFILNENVPDDVVDLAQTQTTSEAVKTLKGSHETEALMSSKQGANALNDAPITGNALQELEDDLYARGEVAGIEAKLEKGVAKDAESEGKKLKGAGVSGGDEITVLKGTKASSPNAGQAKKTTQLGG